MATSSWADPRGPATRADFRVDPIPKGINRAHRADGPAGQRFARRVLWMYPKPYRPFRLDRIPKEINQPQSRWRPSWSALRSSRFYRCRRNHTSLQRRAALLPTRTAFTVFVSLGVCLSFCEAVRARSLLSCSPFGQERPSPWDIGPYLHLFRISGFDA
jgi:hypothetical protein